MKTLIAISILTSQSLALATKPLPETKLSAEVCQKNFSDMQNLREFKALGTPRAKLRGHCESKVLSAVKSCLADEKQKRATCLSLGDIAAVEAIHAVVERAATEKISPEDAVAKLSTSEAK